MPMTIVFTNSKDVTADLVCQELEKSSSLWFRIDTDKIEPDVVAQNLTKLACIPCGTRIWLRRPFEKIGNVVVDRNYEIIESELNACYWGRLMAATNVKWINNPTDNWVAANKIVQHKYCSQSGVCLPETLVTCVPSAAMDFVKSGSTVVKPLNHGNFSDKDSIALIYANECSIDLNFDNVANCPVLLQRCVEGKRDVRIVYILGKLRAFSMEGDSLDIRRRNMESVKYEEIDLPNEISAAYLKMMSHFNLNFCTSDYVVSRQGTFYFLENNPNGQWAWIGLEMHNDLISWFANCLSREDQ